MNGGGRREGRRRRRREEGREGGREGRRRRRRREEGGREGGRGKMMSILFFKNAVYRYEERLPSTSVSLLLSCVPAGCALMLLLNTWLKRRRVSLKK